MGAQAGVTKSIPPGISVSGYPAREHSLSRRIYAGITRIPHMFKKLVELERRVNAMEQGKAEAPTPMSDDSEETGA